MEEAQFLLHNAIRKLFDLILCMCRSLLLRRSSEASFYFRSHFQRFFFVKFASFRRSTRRSLSMFARYFVRLLNILRSVLLELETGNLLNSIKLKVTYANLNTNNIKYI